MIHRGWIELIVFLVLLLIVTIGMARGQVTSTRFDEIKTEQTSETGGMVSGYVSFSYQTGGVRWPQIETRFKHVRGVLFQSFGTYALFYIDGKILVLHFEGAFALEPEPGTNFNDVYFIARGQK